MEASQARGRKKMTRTRMLVWQEKGRSCFVSEAAVGQVVPSLPFRQRCQRPQMDEAVDVRTGRRGPGGDAEAVAGHVVIVED
jgi:hypothetical protein